MTVFEDQGIGACMHVSICVYALQVSICICTGLYTHKNINCHVPLPPQERASSCY